VAYFAGYALVVKEVTAKEREQTDYNRVVPKRHRQRKGEDI
jgi:hypothetical protein